MLSRCRWWPGRFGRAWSAGLAEILLFCPRSLLSFFFSLFFLLFILLFRSPSEAGRVCSLLVVVLWWFWLYSAGLAWCGSPFSASADLRQAFPVLALAGFSFSLASAAGSGAGRRAAGAVFGSLLIVSAAFPAG